MESDGIPDGFIKKKEEVSQYLKDRLRKLRKALGLTQEEFASKIGIKRNSYANYEIGRNHPIDAVVFSICREYHVSETWLRSGEGEMFLPLDEETIIQQWVRDTFTDENASFQRRFAMMMAELSPCQWKELENKAKMLLGRDSTADWEASASEKKTITSKNRSAEK